MARAGLNELFYRDGVGKFRCQICIHERHTHDPKCPIGRAVAALYSSDAYQIIHALDQLDPQRECRPGAPAKEAACAK